MRVQRCTKIDVNVFLHTNDYFEYLLGDLGYTDEEMFVMCNLGDMNLPLTMT
jgi:hypothetical protein